MEVKLRNGCSLHTIEIKVEAMALAEVKLCFDFVSTMLILGGALVSINEHAVVGGVLHLDAE